MLDPQDIQQINDLIKQTVQFHKHKGIDSAILDANDLTNLPIVDLFSQHIDIIHWHINSFGSASNGFNEITSGSGQIQFDDGTMLIVTAAVANGYHGLSSKNPYLGLNTIGKTTSVEWIISNIVAQTQNDTESRVYMTVDTGFPTDTNKHFGFKYIADGTAGTGIVISGTVADGATEATAVLSTYEFNSGVQWIRLRADYTPGTDCKFYINGILKGTITTNLPGVTDLNLNMTLKTVSSIQKEIDFSRVMIVKKY